MSWHSTSYLLVFFNYLLDKVGPNTVTDAAFAYLAQLVRDLAVLLVGLAMLITFSVLASKKSSKLEKIEQEQKIKEAVDAAVKGE